MGFFNMLLIIEFAPLIVGSGDLIPLTSPELCLNLWKKQVRLLVCVWTAWWIGNGGGTPGASECLYQIVLGVTWKCIIEVYYAAQMNGRYQSVQTFDEKSWARRAIIKGLFQVGTCEMILYIKHVNDGGPYSKQHARCLNVLCFY